MESAERIAKVKERFEKEAKSGNFKRTSQTKDVLELYNLGLANEYLLDLSQEIVIDINDFGKDMDAREINYLKRWLKVVLVSKIKPEEFNSIKNDLTFGIWDTRFTPLFKSLELNKRVQTFSSEKSKYLKIQVSDLINPVSSE